MATIKKSKLSIINITTISYLIFPRNAMDVILFRPFHHHRMLYKAWTQNGHKYYIRSHYHSTSCKHKALNLFLRNGDSQVYSLGYFIPSFRLKYHIKNMLLKIEKVQYLNFKIFVKYLTTIPQNLLHLQMIKLLNYFTFAF